jgi:hypothetical protein
MPGTPNSPNLLEQPEIESFQPFLLNKSSKTKETIQQELEVLKTEISNPSIRVILYDNTGQIYQ